MAVKRIEVLTTFENSGAQGTRVLKIVSPGRSLNYLDQIGIATRMVGIAAPRIGRKATEGFGSAQSIFQQASPQVGEKSRQVRHRIARDATFIHSKASENLAQMAGAVNLDHVQKAVHAARIVSLVALAHNPWFAAAAELVANEINRRIDDKQRRGYPLYCEPTPVELEEHFGPQPKLDRK